MVFWKYPYHFWVDWRKPEKTERPIVYLIPGIASTRNLVYHGQSCASIVWIASS